MKTEEEPIRTFKRPLPCDLNEDEKVKKGHKAGMLKKAIQKIRVEMKAATAGHKEELKDKQANLDGILDDLETGTEIRSVECREVKDFTKKKSTVIRADTGEVVESRALLSHELQESFPGPIISDPVHDESEEGPSLAPKRGRGRPRKEARA
jgi:hypothetical protein